MSPNLPPLPAHVVKCLEGHVGLPKGDWTVSIVNDVIQKYQARETKLEGCMREVIALYNDLKTGLATPKRRGFFR